MNSRRLRFLTTALLGAGAFVILIGNLPTRADQSQGNPQLPASSDSRVQIGLNAAPVPLNMTGKNPALVGLGSYFVNVTGDCNGCHSAGPPTEYLPGHNPYLGQSAEINPATYLGGGRNFGQVFGQGPNIISRNLTPDKTGMPEGGRTFEEFRQIIRTGVDLDNVHPNCATAPNCFPLVPPPHLPVVDGSLLQVMPWPNFSAMSDQDLLAIYTYLSAVPCLSQGNPGDLLYNDCGP